LLKSIKNAASNCGLAIRHDWRAQLIVLTATIALVVTAAVWVAFPTARDAATFGGAVFASWLSSLGFFILTGLILSFVTIARPDQELFETRARNLFKRQSGPHIDYIVNRMHEVLEPYCEEISRLVTVTQYDPEEKLFFLHVDTTMTFRSFLVDIPSTLDSTVTYLSATPAPAGRERNCLGHLRMSGETVYEHEEFDDSIEKKFTIKVPQYDKCPVEYRLSYWIKAEEEPNRQRARRFTRSMKVRIRNQLTSKTIKVTFPSNNSQDQMLKAGDEKEIVNLAEIKPGTGEATYDFRLAIG